MYQPPIRPDPWADRIAGIAALRGMLGESTINESSTIGIATRVTMPILQAITIAVSFVLFATGCWALIDGLVVAFGVNISAAMYLLVFTSLGIIVLSIGYLVFRAFANGRPAIKYALSLMIAMFVLTALMSAAFGFRSRFEFWRFVEVLFGAGVVVGSGLLLYHQMLNIVDPYWRTSPAERELLAMWRKAPEIEIDTVNRATRIPYRHGGRRNDKVLVHEPDEVLPELSEYEYLDFLNMARKIGLGRRAWVESMDRYFESTGKKVTKTDYNSIMSRLADEGYVILGGDGYASRWAQHWDAESVYNEECRAFEDTWGDILDLPSAKPANAE